MFWTDCEVEFCRVAKRNPRLLDVDLLIESSEIGGIEER